MNDFGKVAVLMGGSSAEREISLLSGKAILAALLREGVDAHAFDPSARNLWDLKTEGYARAFIALHGRYGEDGTVQGALETMAIPYTGSGVMASAIAMDKWRSKMIWLASGLPSPRYRMLDRQTDLAKVADELGLPLIVKPAREGSSLGVSRVDSLAAMAPAYAAAAGYDPLVLAEEFVAGQELTAAILGERVLPLVRIDAPQGAYDYHNKYFTDAVRYHCPAPIAPEIAAEINRVCLSAFRALGCRGWGRLDLILRPDGRFFLLEMNTVPGMTDHSLVPMAARAAGMSFSELALGILAEARLG